MPRTRDVDDNQSRISAAVWSLLAEGGQSALTMRAVAERAGATTGLLFSTYPDKRSLLTHARVLLHERTSARNHAIEASAPTPAEALRAVLLGAASLTPEKREEARVWLAFLAASVADERLAELHTTYNRAFVDTIERLVVLAHPEVGHADPRATAKSLVALVEGLNSLAAVDAATYSPQVQEAAITMAVTSLP